MLANAPVTTMLPVIDLDRARHFYEDKLGLEPLGGSPDGKFSYAVGGTTLAFMGFAYFLVPLLTRRALWSTGLATVQAYLYGVGLLWMILAMSWAGTLGVPRRTARIDYGGAAPDGWDLPMNLVGVGAGLAGIGGFLFVLNMVLTLLRGRRTDDPTLLAPSGVAA